MVALLWLYRRGLLAAGAMTCRLAWQWPLRHDLHHRAVPFQKTEVFGCRLFFNKAVFPEAF
ncbi:hypothetical protein CFR75_10060 [Komagataeibacter xylinus]|uniref:Uncharacterized protein n=1 Tax=Komagataeibacter xylinus TaxID=28448 RepID=A0A318PM42_KOMXY|nr:hypothetical protein CFR75_10060 [Komagataeibacter xylinus]